MNVYEHGVAAESDEWAGSLRLVSSTDLPVYSGFSLTVVDLEGRSLNEQAVRLGHVNGACYTADYFEESDLRYCVLATLYHLNRIIDLYVALTQLFERTHRPGTAICGNTSDPRVYYEIDAFLGAARRVYESMRKVLWKHYRTGPNGRWRCIRGAVKANAVPEPFAQKLRASWDLFGQRLTEYRDCMTHNDPLTDGATTCRMEWYGSRWGMNVKLPSNPGAKSRQSFDFATGPEALNYCHTVACHLVDVCQALETTERVRHHLDNPRMGKARENSPS
jgi:hypothetical protein